MIDVASKKSGFRGGATLVVLCGWGRSIAIDASLDRSGWHIKVVNAQDFITLSHLQDFSAQEFLKILDADNELSRFDLTLQNPNGLLNLVAWSRNLNGHLVPHASLPDGAAAAGVPTNLVIQQNALRKPRHEVAVACNFRRLLDAKGCWKAVRRADQGYFVKPPPN